MSWSTPWAVRNQKNKKKHTLLEYSEGQTKSSFTKLLMMCSFQWTNGHFCSICSIWHFIYLLFIILINYHNGMERRKNYKMYATQTYADLYDWLTLTENHKHLWSVYCPSVHPFIRPSIWLWIVSFSQATFYHSVYPFIHPSNQSATPPKSSKNQSRSFSVSHENWTSSLNTEETWLTYANNK